MSIPDARTDREYEEYVKERYKKMTYEKFEKLVSKLTNAIPYDYKGDVFYVENGSICQKHEDGGAQGGNCWGDEAEHYTNIDAPSDFLPLDSILKEVAPTISYLQYKDIEKLITEHSDHDSEYYGNYTNFSIYKLDIRKLYGKIFA